MMCWTFNVAENAPAFILARAGYDVWLGNNRGNRWSRNHVKYDNKSKEFWDEIDWEQMGVHDTPTVINFILNATGHT